MSFGEDITDGWGAEMGAPKRGTAPTSLQGSGQAVPLAFGSSAAGPSAGYPSTTGPQSPPGPAPSDFGQPMMTYPFAGASFPPQSPATAPPSEFPMRTGAGFGSTAVGEATLSFGAGSGGRPSAGGRSSGMGDAVARYDALSTSVVEGIQVISQNVQSIRQMVSKLGTADDLYRLRKRLAATSEATRTLARTTGTSLKEMGSLGASRLELRERSQLELAKLRNSFGTALETFKQIEKVSMQKQNQSVAREASTMKARASDLHAARADWEEDEEDESAGLVGADSKAAQVLVQEEELEFREMLVEDRRKGIEETCRAVEDVNEIMRDLAIIIKEQEPGINMISQNIEDAEHRTRQAHAEMRKANAYDKSFRSKMCYLFVIVAIICTILIAVLVHGSKH